jgi:tetratricopeptide (TPR) repeat protein
MLSKKILITVLTLSTFGCTSLSAFGRSKFSDPGILLSSKTVKGTTYERYSDGLIAEYTLKGYRKEKSDDDDFEAEMTPPTNGDAESWAREIMGSPESSTSPNNSGFQSRLRQYVEICLNENHGAHALKEANRYLEIQQTIKATGLPLAIGQELLGRVYLQLGKEEGSKLLATAVHITNGLNNGELKKEIDSQLAFKKKQPVTVSLADIYPGNMTAWTDVKSIQNKKNSLPPKVVSRDKSPTESEVSSGANSQSSKAHASTLATNATHVIGQPQTSAKHAANNVVLSQRLKNILKQPSHSPTSPWTEEQMIAEGVRHSAEQLQHLEADAELSEKLHRGDAWRKCRDFAVAEAQIGDLDNAVRSARHAIALYKHGDDIPIYSDAILVTAGNFRSLADALRRQGRDADAQRLLKEALDKLSTEHGPKSSPVAAQYANIVAYWVGSNNESEALKKLDEMLKLPARVVEVDGPYQSGLGQLYSIVDALRAKKRTELAHSILKRIMESQIRQLGPDDYRLSTTKIKVAQLAQSLGDYAEGERELFDAIKIRTKFVGLRAISEQANELQTLLPKIGRDADNKWVDIPFMGRLQPSILRQFGFAAEADSLEKNGRLPKTFIDARYPNEDHLLADDDDLQNEANLAFKQAPYSSRTNHANKELLENSLRTMNWNVLEKSGAILASIYEHSSDNVAGRRTGCVSSDIDRIDCYLASAKANLKMGKAEEAQKWIDRASNVLPDISCFENQSLGEMAIELGNNDAAKKFLDRALIQLTNQYSAVGRSLPHLYKKIGDMEGARKARAKLDVYDLEYKRRRAESQSQDHVFDHIQL